MQKEDFKDEYVEVSANMRQFGNIRFAQLVFDNLKGDQ